MKLKVVQKPCVTSVSGGGKLLKALPMAILAGLSVICNPTYAKDSATVDFSKVPIDTPTLDYLHQQGVEFTDESGNVLKDYASSYTLTNVDSPSDNTITKYDINKSTGEIIKTQDYSVNFKSATSADNYVDKYSDVVSGNTYTSPILDNPTGVVADSINEKVYKNNTYSKTFTSYYDYNPYALIVNSGDIEDINADFVANNINFSNNQVSISGIRGTTTIADFVSGAIYNNGKINNISGDFIDNSITFSRVNAYWTSSAISNDYNGTISNITGTFASNQNTAIYNRGIIGNITGSFINNNNGSIINDGKISNIVGDFYQSRIENYGEISNIAGDFINSGNNGYAAINNYNGYYDYNTRIKNIVGNFIGNSSGAIYNNEGVIDNVTGYFAGNGYDYSSQGAIYNSNASINVTNSIFVENASTYSGGAISSNFNGTFRSDSEFDRTSRTCNANIKSSIFTNNKAFAGGAIGSEYYMTIYSGYQPRPISLDEEDMSAGWDRSSFVNQVKDLISVNIEDSIFNGNIAEYAGGAVSVLGGIREYYRDYPMENALAIDTTSGSDNTPVLNIKNSKFINNSIAHWYEQPGPASIETFDAYLDDNIDVSERGGGAIATNGTTIIENSLFDGNKAVEGNGGAIFALPEAYTLIDYNSIPKSLDENSGIALMSNDDTLGYIVYDNGASATDANGLVIKNSSFINNTASSSLEVQTPDIQDYWEYLYDSGNYEIINNLEPLFIAEAEKRGYDPNGNIPEDVAMEIIMDVIGSTQEYKDFVKMVEVSQIAHGGAIYSAQNTKIIADNADVVFKNNKVINQGVETYNDIYMLTTVGQKQEEMVGSLPTATADEIKDLVTLTLDARNGGSIVLNGTIDGGIVTYSSQNNNWGGELESLAMESTGDDSKTEFQPAYRLAVTGDGTGKVVFGNSVYNAEITTYKDSMSVLAKDSNWDNNILVLNGGTVSMVNNEVGVSNLNRMLVTNDTNIIADVDLKNAEMDRFTASEYSEHIADARVNVVGMNLLSDAKEDKTEIYFAEQGLKDNVTNGTGELPDANQTVYTPIYKYNVSYDNRDDGGYFVFNRGGSAGGNVSDAFNPSILAAPVSSVAASQATINETFKYVFEHADTFTKMPSMDRMTKINTNKYALSTDFDENRELIGFDHNNTAGWFRPYVTFEKMSLNHGPKVDAVTYGSLAGFDTDFHEHRNGWYSVGTGYVGYNGSQLHYNGVSTTMNGGLLGYTHTMYKGNFWSALTLSAGASVGESRTMYGKEDFTSLMAGLGSKTGYNFEFKEGKYILQPIMFMSYTFVNTFDYTNAAGVRVKPSPAHSIQLNPSVRFITNTKNGWQPYVSAGVVWNVMNENKVLANNVRLPEMSMKPYVEYGVGVQRNWKDKFTAFGQAMLRNGGRNGIALTGGFRWALGTEGKPIEKVQDKEVVHTAQNDAQRKVIKQLSPAQRTALGASPQNTSRTTMIGSIRQL